MSDLCTVLLSVACLFNSLAIAIHVWSVRPFRPSFSVKDLRRSNDLQRFLDEEICTHSRPFVEGETAE